MTATPTRGQQPPVQRTAPAPEALPDRAAALLAEGHRVALVAGHDDRPAGGGLRAVYLFTRAATADRAESRVELHVRLDPTRPRVPSLAGLSFPAGRFEREMRDLFGMVPVDHPLPHRLVRHFHWPRGWHPMLSDAGEPPAFGDGAPPPGVHGNTGRPRPNRQRRFVLPVGDPRLEYRAPTRSTPRQGCGPVGLRQQPMIVC